MSLSVCGYQGTFFFTQVPRIIERFFGVIDILFLLLELDGEDYYFVSRRCGKAFGERINRFIEFRLKCVNYLFTQSLGLLCLRIKAVPLLLLSG